MRHSRRGPCSRRLTRRGARGGGAEVARFGLGLHARSQIRVSPSARQGRPTSCSITIERGTTLVLGTALPLAGLLPSTTGRSTRRTLDGGRWNCGRWVAWPGLGSGARSINFAQVSWMGTSCHRPRGLPERRRLRRSAGLTDGAHHVHMSPRSRDMPSIRREPAVADPRCASRLSCGPAVWPMPLRVRPWKLRMRSSRWFGV